jgi:hypothetical protein
LDCKLVVSERVLDAGLFAGEDRSAISRSASLAKE